MLFNWMRNMGVLKGHGERDMVAMLEYQGKGTIQVDGHLGYTVGRWEGDTLLLDSISFVDSTWLGRGGFFHSEQMHVVERFTRQGDVILYDVTVEDPEVLVEPWLLSTHTLRHNTNPDAGLQRERGNCEVYELNSISSQIRH